MICSDIIEPVYFLFSNSVPQLLYYSHIPTAFIAIVISIFIFYKSRNLTSKILLFISIIFFTWLTLNLIIWTNVQSDLIIFATSLFGMLNIFLFVSVSYFFFVFINKSDIPLSYKIFSIILSTPFVLMSQSNVSEFNLLSCEATGGETYYTAIYIFEFIVFLIILYSGIKHYIQEKTDFKKQILLLLIGVESFLLLFFITGFLSSYLAEQGYENAFELEQYGLFGMTFFIGVLAFLIVKYKAFNIKLIGAQALVVALWFLVGSLLFVAVSNTTRVIAVITLVFTTIAGYFLVRSVKREVALREQFEDLVFDLAKANDRLKELDKMKSEFVSIASHQLRSPLTSIRGYASMLVEGSYGKLPAKAQEALQNIADSSMYMVRSVEDYLSVSRIEAGNMKYEMSDFSLKETAERLVDELRAVAIKKGLVLVFRSDCSGNGTIHADIGKTRQVLQNLIDNSMKYTPKGTITVIAHDDMKKKKMYVTIHDTGVGMSKETLEEVFDKFVRAKNANSINVTGTGLGLYVAKKMVDSMGGKVWAESEGEGQGSTFHIEFPLVPGK